MKTLVYLTTASHKLCANLPVSVNIYYRISSTGHQRLLLLNGYTLETATCCHLCNMSMATRRDVHLICLVQADKHFWWNVHLGVNTATCFLSVFHSSGVVNTTPLVGVRWNASQLSQKYHDAIIIPEEILIYSILQTKTQRTKSCLQK